MTLFFVRDSRHRHRLFKASPAVSPDVRFSRARLAFERAKEKLLLLPQRILRREQAFAEAAKLKEGEEVVILHSGLEDERHIRRKFRLFLHKQRTSHLILLTAEALLLPFAALSGLLPGPNVAFYSLALIMILQWRALRGIRRLLRGPFAFRTEPILGDWERAAAEGLRDEFPFHLERIERELGVAKAAKILLRAPGRRSGSSVMSL